MREKELLASTPMMLEVVFPSWVEILVVSCVLLSENILEVHVVIFEFVLGMFALLSRIMVK